MIRVKGRYRDGKLELDKRLDLPDGTEVLIALERAQLTADEEDQACMELGMSALEEVWDNPKDAIYDELKKKNGA